MTDAVDDARYVAPNPTAADGWRLERLTEPSRLFGANGLRTGPDGRNWKVRVVIEGEKLDATGMLVDFLDVKSLMGEILDRIDHQFLNEIPPFDSINPSAENIAEYFYQQLTGRLAGTPVPVRIREVKIWETGNSSRPPTGRKRLTEGCASARSKRRFSE